jgi:hypothetical protein
MPAVSPRVGPNPPTAFVITIEPARGIRNVIEEAPSTRSTASSGSMLLIAAVDYCARESGRVLRRVISALNTQVLPGAVARRTGIIVGTGSLSRKSITIRLTNEGFSMKWACDVPGTTAHSVVGCSLKRSALLRTSGA